MKYLHLIWIAALMMAGSCSKNQITKPPFNPYTNLDGTLPVSDVVMRNMEGIYNLSNGSGNLGTQFVCKVSKKRVSFFSNDNGIFMILRYGLNPTDSSIQFAGFWRYSQTTTQGNIGFSIPKNNGGGDLLLNGIPDNIKIAGMFLDADLYTKDLTLQFGRAFTKAAKDKDFAIFAHHGVETVANPPYAENSIDGALNDEDYGVNGLEFDVRMTADHIPICIHDPSINTRLTLKGPLSGDWDQYSYSLLNDYIRLRDGQRVPTVEEVLDTFITSTNMKYMWLDIKGNTDIFKYMEPIVRKANDKAAALNRTVYIITDIPSQLVIDEYKTQPSYASLLTMCETSFQDVVDLNCKYWGPRYSQGLLLDEVDKAHSLGKKVYSWTLNEKNIIDSYIRDGRFDGFISDYPAYVVYDFYTMF